MGTSISSFKKYYEKHGNIDVPSNYVTEEGLKLGLWLTNRRRAYMGKANYVITEEQIKLLNDLGMKWTINRSWEENYEFAKKYYEEHGNIDVSQNYVTEDGFRLGLWLCHNRRSYIGKSNWTLTEKQITLLNDLGMKWRINRSWEENYEFVKKYYEEHGNIDIAQSYVTEDKIPLGRWLNTCRQFYKSFTLSNQKIQLLNALDIDWNTRETHLLNQNITNLNINNYQQILLSRFNRTLDDLICEGFDEIEDVSKQKKIENILVKRLWR